MANFYLFLPRRNPESVDLSSQTLSWVFEDESAKLKLAHGLLSDAANAAAGNTICVVIPGEDVLFLQADVPGKNQQRIQQAVPYILEDSVIDDVDELYFAIAKENNEPTCQTYNVAAINKEYFKWVVGQLKNAGLNADAIIADYDLLESNDVLLFDGERILFHSSTMRFSSSIEFLSNLDNIKELKLINCDEKNNTLLHELAKLTNVKEELCELHPRIYLIKNKSDHKGVNLLQGSYKKKKDWSLVGKAWLPVAALFVVWLCVQSGLFVADYINLNKQNKSLNIEITKIYKRTFPKARRIVDAKAQMQQKLKSLKKRRGQTGRSFNEMLSSSASAFSNAKGLIIKSLRYYDGRINIEIDIASLQALDKLKEQLNKENGYQVEIQNASSGKETVTARMQITGAKS